MSCPECRRVLPKDGIILVPLSTKSASLGQPALSSSRLTEHAVASLAQHNSLRVRKDSGDREATRTFHVHEVAVGTRDEALHLVALLLKVFRWGQKIVRDWHLDEKCSGAKTKGGEERAEGDEKSVKIKEESSHKHALEALHKKGRPSAAELKKGEGFCEF